MIPMRPFASFVPLASIASIAAVTPIAAIGGVLLLSAVVCASPCRLQGHKFETYLESKWPVNSERRARLTVAKFLHEAERDGILLSLRDRRSAKRVWTQLVHDGKHLRVGHQQRRVQMHSDRRPANRALTEREYNRAIGSADALGVLSTAGLVMQGTIVSTQDADCFAFRTAADGQVQLRLKGRGSSPITSAALSLLTPNGYVYRRAPGGATTLGQLQLDLPAGNYVVRVEGRGLGSYSLDLGYRARTIPSLSLKGSLQTSFSQTQQLFRIKLSQAGKLRLKITSASDSILELYSGSLVWMYEVDDDSTSQATDAGLNALLPAGTYFLAIDADRAAAATITTSFKAAAIPVVSCNANWSASIPGGSEDFQLYQVDLKQAREITLSLQPRGTTNALKDSYLFLYDRIGNSIAESDDDWATTGSIISASLPGARYYFASTGFWGAGDYKLTVRCGQPVLRRVAVGDRLLSTVPKKDGYVSIVVDLGTQAGLEFELHENTIPDAQLGLVNAVSGLARGFSDDGILQRGPEIAGSFAKGRYYAIVKDFCGDDGSFALELRAPLQRKGATSRLAGLGKSGDYAVVVVAAKTTAGLRFSQFRGVFQLDLGLGLVLGARLIPGHGEIDYGLDFMKNTGLIFQVLHVDNALLGGRFTNLLR